MRIDKSQNNITIIKPDPVSFGILKGFKKTNYGQYTWGEFKGYKIEIYDDVKDKAKLYYVSDNIRRWVKSKLIYLDNSIKKIIRSNSNGV